jgi:hypothetical protein
MAKAFSTMLKNIAIQYVAHLNVKVCSSSIEWDKSCSPFKHNFIYNSE